MMNLVLQDLKRRWNSNMESEQSLRDRQVTAYLSAMDFLYLLVKHVMPATAEGNLLAKSHCRSETDLIRFLTMVLLLGINKNFDNSDVSYKFQ